MCDNNNRYESILIIHSQLLKNDNAQFSIPFGVWLCFLIFLCSCNLQTQTGSQATTTPILESENNKTVTIEATEIIFSTSTPVLPSPTGTSSASLPSEPSAAPSATPQPNFGTETINTTVTPTSEPEEPTGHLFLYNSTGIQKLALTDGTTEHLLTAEDNWLDWGAHFAQNGKYLAYWVKHANDTELWFTSLEQWQPELILEIENMAYDFATPLWAVNDRYLLFDLSILDTSRPLEDIKTLRTYIINIETMELVSQPYWEGDCSILATSPQTNQLALWCHKTSDQDDSQEYFVLEPDADPWLTEQPPDVLIDNCLIMLICAWSLGDKWVAYAVTDNHPDLLFFTAVNNPILKPLDDGLSDVYVFPSWSPNNQFLYYTGACGDGTTINCPNVVSIHDHQIIWRARNNSNQGEFGNIFVDHVVWSPDSNYIAMPIVTNVDSGIEMQVLIFDIITQQEIARISNLENAVLDMVWVDE